MSSINWFPGHMAKTLRDLHDIKKIDLILEVVDARAINISNNPALVTDWNKPKITIALKADLADIKTNNGANLLIGSIKDKKFKSVIAKKINDILEGKIVKLKAKGLIKPQFHILIVGLPNIGKSSLINFMGSNKRAIVENRPGVTRTAQLIKINDGIYMYDTPGVLAKKIEKDEDGYILALIGTIKKEILPLNEIVRYAFQFHSKYYPSLLSNYFNLSSLDITYEEFLKHVGQLFHFITKNNQPDNDKIINFLYTEFMNGKIGKVNYEK